MRHCTGAFSERGYHWVGDGFPVCTLFSHQKAGNAASPFLLLDHAGPHDFQSKVGHPRGVGAHPHKGFETVTIVYDGEVEHRDSTGAGGLIGPGDVQWMTAGGGILHEEFHSETFSRTGGRFDMVQLWVNLPAAHKSAPAAYQNITADMIPTLQLVGWKARIIAGAFGDQAGPARTFTPINLWDLQIAGPRRIQLPVPASHNLTLVVLNGKIRLADFAFVGGDSLMLGPEDEAGSNGLVEVNILEDTVLLVLSGEPIHEPIVAYGPFVMNDMSEIRAAVEEFNQGRFGTIRRGLASQGAGLSPV